VGGGDVGGAEERVDREIDSHSLILEQLQFIYTASRRKISGFLRLAKRASTTEFLELSTLLLTLPAKRLLLFSYIAKQY